VFKKFKKLATCCKPGCFSTFHFCSKWISCQPVKIVGNLVDLSRHVVLDLSPKNEKSCELVRIVTSCKLVGNPGCQLRFPTSLQLVRLVEFGLYCARFHSLCCLIKNKQCFYRNNKMFCGINSYNLQHVFECCLSVLTQLHNGFVTRLLPCRWHVVRSYVMYVVCFDCYCFCVQFHLHFIRYSALGPQVCYYTDWIDLSWPRNPMFRCVKRYYCYGNYTAGSKPILTYFIVVNGELNKVSLYQK